MDRFIAADYGKNWLNASDLKSSMDRFIEYTQPFAYCFLNI